MENLTSVELGEDFLAHYGVKGMHWGIRKDKTYTGFNGREVPYDPRVTAAALQTMGNRKMDRINASR